MNFIFDKDVNDLVKPLDFVKAEARCGKSELFLINLCNLQLEIVLSSKSTSVSFFREEDFIK